MTPPQLKTLAGIHPNRVESVVIEREYGKPGNIRATYWLQNGSCHIYVVTPEGSKEIVCSP